MVVYCQTFGNLVIRANAMLIPLRANHWSHALCAVVPRQQNFVKLAFEF